MRLKRLRPLLQKGQHLRHRIARHGSQLHGLRVAVHVHQANAAGRMARHGFQRARLAQRPNVVDDVRPRIQRGGHDFGLVGIDRDGRAHPDSLAQHRQHARQLLRQRNGGAAGASGFAANVQNVRPLAQQPLAVAQRRSRAGMLAAV